ncbi:MAG TPA: hypothetical protein VIH99_08070 [Bdellovibrionota bacterium]|jgi:Ca2+-binding EF-hand superfamily protein
MRKIASLVLLSALLFSCSRMSPKSSAVGSDGSAFEFYDTDRNGYLDVLETDDVIAAQFSERDADGSGRLEGKEVPGAEELALIDADHDGKLTIIEYMRLSDLRFGRADGDKNRFVSRDEAKALNLSR